MKRSIVIIAFVIAAVVIIPIVAQTSRSGNAQKACPLGQGECQGQGQACKGQCEEGKNCEECPKKASGECQGCEKQCEEGKKCEDCPKKASGECQGCEKKCEEGECPKAGECKKACDAEEAPACGSAQGGCGMMGQGMGMGQCDQN